MSEQLLNQLLESAMYILMSEIYKLQLDASYNIIKPLKLFRKTCYERFYSRLFLT